MRLDSRIEQSDVALDGRGHRRPVPLPERGAALDVGEEEGDGTGGEIGHDPLQTLGGTWCVPIVARGHGDHARGSAPSRGGVHNALLLTLSCNDSDEGWKVAV